MTLDVCAGGGAVPAGAAAGEGLALGLDVEVLPAGVEAELEAEVLPPSPILRGTSANGGV